MNIKQENVFKEFKKLVAILEKEKIWYSLTLGTLLGAWKFKGFIPWDDDVDILIKKEGLLKLMKKYPNNILTTKDKGYPLLLPKWVANKEEMHTNPVFIDLFTLVKTNEKKIKHWRRFSNKLRFGIYAVHGEYKCPDLPQKILRFVTYPIKPFIRKNVDFFKELNLLEDKSDDRWYYVNNPVQTNDWSLLPVFFTDELTTLEFEGIQVKAIKCYREWLEYRYKGINMTPPVGKKIQSHINAHSIEYVIYKG